MNLPSCSWTCAPCYVQHEADVNNHRVPAKPKLEKALKTAAEAAAKVPSADKRLKIFRGWPMRYLGLHNLAEDTMGASKFVAFAPVSQLTCQPCFYRRCGRRNFSAHHLESRDQVSGDLVARGRRFRAGGGHLREGRG